MNGVVEVVVVEEVVVGCVVRICVCVWCVSVWVKREAAGASASKQATGQTGVDLYV
jgi:hypothetical protein